MPTLEENIENYLLDFQKNVPKETQDVLNNAIEKLKESKKLSKALKVGDKIPEFSLSNHDRKIINIKDIVEKNKYTVLNFFDGSWSPYSNLQLMALQKVASQLKILNAALITLSPQTQDKSLYLFEKHSLNFDILYDKNNTIAKEFGIVYTLSDEVISTYDKLKVDILEANRNGTFDLPSPATYIVNKNYEIIYAFVDENYRKRCEPKTIIDVIKKDMINKR
ncbi:MAG: alkyl hydroperoxide reductase [Arcobacter sp.]|uniref:peroxiredoxin-like family protein n=1 Tax=uncultured Arcobacter sp. TaxID=165434 RepID=UPI000CA83D36|nr:peroxiredoxin-like family protein [uncultured Arcobacter sp.]PLY09077.1 MAG: alkyl hydroperoxide reductase [Arcobacter sp.]